MEADKTDPSLAQLRKHLGRRITTIAQCGQRVRELSYVKPANQPLFQKTDPQRELVHHDRENTIIDEPCQSCNEHSEIKCRNTHYDRDQFTT